MLLLALLLLTCAAPEGGVACPRACRCDGVGSVACVDAALTSVPSDLSDVTVTLDISMNELSELPSFVFVGLRRLLELRLAGNSLMKISSEAFTGLDSLKLLNLQNNKLRRVPSDALQKLKNLRSLRLDANFLSHLPAPCFVGLASLRHLWLEENDLPEVPVEALSVLTELQALTLAANNISAVPERAFASLRRLLVLHLHGNRIRSLGRRSFDGLHSLETLDLSFNRIAVFPTAIKRLGNLRDLNLQNNNIRVVPENAFSGNPSIRTINIQNNPLLSVGHSAFQLLPDLQKLDLTSGRLSSSSLRTLRSLTHLRMKHQQTLRGAGLLSVCHRQSERPSSRAATWCPDLSSPWLLFFSISFIFIISTLPFLFLFLFLPPKSSQLHLLLLLLLSFLLLCGLSRCIVGSESGLRFFFFSCFLFEIFIVMVVFKDKTWIRAVFVLGVTLFPLVSLCSSCFLLSTSCFLLTTSCFLFTTSCFLLTVAAHVTRCRGNLQSLQSEDDEETPDNVL